MRERALQLLIQRRTLFHAIDTAVVVSVPDMMHGLVMAKEILYHVVDQKTALYLSGGRTPIPLYEAIAREERLVPGVVGLVDERFGEPMHDGSNEKMITHTGLVRYFSMRDIPYYTVLHGLFLEKTAQRYDELYRSFRSVYPKTIGILGIGDDGHTAGILPNRKDFHNRLFDAENQYEMFSWCIDNAGEFKNRLTLTFLGLTMLDFFIILAFGDKKKEVLQKMFTTAPGEKNEEDLPARFYLRPAIASKVLLITDQAI